MRIKTQDYNDITVMELQGELDAEGTEQFRERLDSVVSKGRVGVVLDMCGTSFIDSQGLEQLLWARDYCMENTCQLRLAGLDDTCMKILEITRLGGEFDRYGELSEAVKSFA